MYCGELFSINPPIDTSCAHVAAFPDEEVPVITVFDPSNEPLYVNELPGAEDELSVTAYMCVVVKSGIVIDVLLYADEFSVPTFISTSVIM
jgi:hypothetical protein